MDCYPGQPPLQVTAVLSEAKLEPGTHTEHHHTLEEYAFNSNLRPQSTQSIAKCDPMTSNKNGQWSSEIVWPHYLATWVVVPKGNVLCRLDDNYHYEEGICLPRSTIYDHYVDHCTREKLQPVNAASFGKIIRQQYPSLTTRRLGTRGQSKYHYFGLGIKPTSRYYTADYLEKQHGQGTTRKEPEAKKTHTYYSDRKEKPSAVLPPFPNVNSMELTANISKDKLHTFMVMYRAHCQRILDSVVRATFSEVQNFLYHFWQGMPSHLHPILATDIVTDLIAICDTTLYKAITNVYITDPLQSIPDNVAQEVHLFAGNLKDWLECALKGLPDSLKTIKYQIAAVFKKSLHRQHSLMNLADATRNALHGDDPLDQLAEDWATLDIQHILAHTLFAVQPLNLSDQCALLVPEFLEEFSQVLSEQKTSVEDFVVWVERVVEKCINKEGAVNNRKEVSRTFLLTWKFFTSKIVRELTLMSAPSFGTFHLIHMLIDDYIVHTLESSLEAEQEKEFTQRIHALESEAATISPEVSQSLPTTSAPLQSTSTTEVPLIAEPPSTFTFTPDLPSPSQRSDDVTTPDQTLASILSPPIHPLQPDNSLRGSNASLSSTVQQTGRGRIETQTEPASLQSLITSHGIGAFNNIVPQSTTQGGLTQGHSLQGSLALSNSSSSLNIATSEVQIPQPPQLPVTSVSFTRHQDPSLSLSFLPPQPHPPVQSNIGSFSLPALTLPPHLQSGDHHSLSFETSSQSLNGLLGDSSAQSRNLSQILNPQKDLSPQQNICVSTTSPQSESIFSSSASIPGVPPPMPVSLPHPIMASGNLPGGLTNPSTLPLFPGVPNMYSYPYPNSLQPLPSQSVSSSMPPFPPQGLMSRYPAPYVTHSLYSGSQPPITNTNYNR